MGIKANSNETRTYILDRMEQNYNWKVKKFTQNFELNRTQ